MGRITDNQKTALELLKLYKSNHINELIRFKRYMLNHNPIYYHKYINYHKNLWDYLFDYETDSMDFITKMFKQYQLNKLLINNKS